MTIRDCPQCGKPITVPNKRLCTSCRETPNPRCKKCKKVKPLSRFSHDESRPSGYFPWCKDCQTASNHKPWQNSDDEPNGYICPVDGVVIRGHANRRFCSATCKNKSKALRDRFNLTPEQHQEMIDNTGGVCPICLKRPTVWPVDHRHSDRQVMGVVCTACNVGALAFTYHDPEYIRRLLDFVENPPALALGIDVKVPEGANRPSNIHKVWQHSGKNKR